MISLSNTFSFIYFLKWLVPRHYQNLFTFFQKQKPTCYIVLMVDKKRNCLVCYSNFKSFSLTRFLFAQHMSSDRKAQLVRFYCDFQSYYIAFSFEKDRTILMSNKGRFHRFSSQKGFGIASLYNIYFSFSQFSTWVQGLTRFTEILLFKGSVLAVFNASYPC